jgi:hypothetical protein
MASHVSYVGTVALSWRYSSTAAKHRGILGWLPPAGPLILLSNAADPLSRTDVMHQPGKQTTVACGSAAL